MKTAEQRLIRIVFASARSSARAHLFSGLQLTGVNKAVSEFLDMNAEMFCGQLDRIEVLGSLGHITTELDELELSLRSKLRMLARIKTSSAQRALKSHVWTQQLGIVGRIAKQLVG